MCLYVRDSLDRVYALTARHVAADSPGAVLDETLTIPTQVGCPADGTLSGPIVRTTTQNWEYYDVVVVRIASADVGRLRNTPYGTSRRVQRIGSANPAPGTAATFHGAAFSFGTPRPAQVMSASVVQVSPETGVLPSGRMWIEFNATLSKGDSGGLFTSSDGTQAIAMLQLGRLMNGDSSANPVYGVPLAAVFADLKNEAPPGSCLPGYERLELAVL